MGVTPSRAKAWSMVGSPSSGRGGDSPTGRAGLRSLVQRKKTNTESQRPKRTTNNDMMDQQVYLGNLLGSLSKLSLCRPYTAAS